MKRHAIVHRPKHIRRVLERLAGAGIADVLVEVGKRYVLSWRVGGVPMRVTAALSESSRTFDRVWRAIRALFRARGLPVPA